MPSFEVTPIGTVRNDRTDIQHTDNWGAVRSTITVDERFDEACLQGLDGFSHVEVLFVLDQFPEQDDYREPRPYRGRSDLPPVGVFAGRGPRRPNRIGVTCCVIESVQGRELTVVGLDAVSGTPVIDLKPTMAEFRAVDLKQPEWVSRMMSEYFQPQAPPPAKHRLRARPATRETPLARAPIRAGAAITGAAGSRPVWPFRRRAGTGRPHRAGHCGATRRTSPATARARILPPRAVATARPGSGSGQPPRSLSPRSPNGSRAPPS